MGYVCNSNPNKISGKLLILSLITLFATNLVYGEKLNSDLQNFEQKNGRGYKIAGICFSSVGGACLITSIPFYIMSLHEANDENMIGSNILGVFGDCFSIGGLVLGGISIPLYIKHKKLNKPTMVSFNLGSNTINLFYEF